MNISNETGDLILKILGGLLAFFSLRWVIKIFAGKDGKLDRDELKKVTAYFLFIWAFVYVILKEGNRPSNVDHIFSETWVFFIISALLTVLAMDKVFDNLARIIELFIKLKSKVPNETKTDSPLAGTDRGASSGLPGSSQEG